MAALTHILCPEIVVFAPAYPENKRTTINGIQYIKDIPLDKSELSRDPKNPVITADIRQLLTGATNLNFNHINIDSIRNDEIPELLRDHEGGCFSFDAENDEDLQKIVKETLKVNKYVLWVGSAVLATALM